jgi:hypothetical protein
LKSFNLESNLGSWRRKETVSVPGQHKDESDKSGAIIDDVEWGGVHETLLVLAWAFIDSTAEQTMIMSHCNFSPTFITLARPQLAHTNKKSQEMPNGSWFFHTSTFPL